MNPPGLRLLRNWGLALRVARREAWRHKGRSLLVVAMLALPVAGAAAADTLWRSSQVTATEQAVRDMGRYDALVVASDGTPVYQNIPGSRSGPATSTGSGAQSPAAHGDAAGLAALLPPGARIVGPMSRSTLQAVIADRTGRTWADLREVDLGDPLTEGIAERRAGAAPTADDQVAISSELAKKLGKGIGDTIDLRVAAFAADAAADVKDLHITGIYDGNDDPYKDQVFARRGAFAGGAQQIGEAYFVALPGGMDWSLVQKLNQHGFTAESKKVVADPPPHSQVPYYTSGIAAQYGEGDAFQAVTMAVAAIALSMVLLEVVLLAGPAFAVSARRRRRDFGLLGAAGADGRRLRRFVLADGVVLGLVGGVLGTVVGVAGAALGLPFFAHVSRQNPGGFRVLPDELLAAAAVGVLTGVAAALAPAIVTARQDVLAALTGRRGQVRTPWKLPLAGLVGIAAGTALVLFGSVTRIRAVPVVIGIGIGELGVVACTPLLVGFSGRLARVLPLTGRLAVRDGARNRGRTAPAVAAIMAAVAGASAIAMILTSQDAQDRHDYRSDLVSGQAAVSLNQGLTVDPSRLAAQIAAVLPDNEYAIVDGVSIPTGPDLIAGSRTTARATPGPVTFRTPNIERTPANTCPPISGTPDDAFKAGFMQRQTDPRCGYNLHGGYVASHYSTGAAPIITGGPELLRAVLGRSDPDAEGVLKAGGIVVFDPLDLYTVGAHSTVRVTATGECVNTPSSAGTQLPATPAAGPPDCGGPPTSVTLPAALTVAPRALVHAVVAPAAFDKLGVAHSPQSIIYDTTRTPTAAEQKKADDLAAAAGVEGSFYVERGYQGQTWVGLVALAAVAGVVMLGAAAIATGLAITDAQADLETLAAVGARPRVRRVLAGSQAAATAGLGAVLGALFGLLPAVGLLEVRHSAAAKQAVFGPPVGPVQLVVPWLFLVLVIVALPMLAAFGAAGMTRSRISMRQRRD